MKINILSQETILQIAAGEIVERPASVVKELVENAIDAGATIVTIEAFAGGLDKIIVSDDGEGIGINELATAVLRHATSKIKNSADLFSVSTLGFRGEALAAIGAVSTMTIASGRRESAAGGAITVIGGQGGQVETVANPGGTTVTVENLFFNTPARKKFLRKPAAEYTALASVVHQQLLSRPGIRFRLYHNGKLTLSSPGNGSLRDAIAALAGTEIAENLLECTGSAGTTSIRGYICQPEYHRGNRGLQYFSVNGRPTSLRLLGSAVEQAFHTLLPINRYPLAFLNVEIPGDLVDVNVHPTKREVKFREAGTIFTLALKACSQALAAVTAVPYSPSGNQVPYQVSASPPQGLRYGTKPLPPVQYPAAVQEALPLPPQLSAAQSEDYTILGQIFSTFLVVATPWELRLVDQHAAQERVLYEKYLELLTKRQKAGQATIPLEAPLSGRSRQFIEAWLPQLGELGFSLELTEGGVILKEAPILFKKALGVEDILEIIERLQQSEDGNFNFADYRQTTLMLMACKGAIKGNQRLSAAESRQLLVDLTACENSRTCPHGRPIWVAFDRINLEKLFARR